MCGGGSPKPAAAAAPAPTAPPTSPDLGDEDVKDAKRSQRKAKKRGKASLKIDLGGTAPSTGSNGLNIPKG